jgi:hypothetical protein
METGELARSKYAVVATWSNGVQSPAMCIVLRYNALQHSLLHCNAADTLLLRCIVLLRLEFKAVLEADESAATKRDVHAALAQLKKLQEAQDAKDKGRLVATLCNTLRHDGATPCNTLRHDATQQHAPKQRDSLQSSCRGPRIRAGREKAICALRQI